MKKIIVVFFVAFLSFSCTSYKQPMISQPLYDVLFGSDFGGASFQFYEIVTEDKEFNILLTDDMIKPYVKKTDIETCNFILINMGEKPTAGYSINVKSVKELPDKIVVTLKEIAPKGNYAAAVVTKPCYVIRIKSKKPIEII
ncbi:protease complex subunit PrcB family protein [Flavobacterium sp. SUN052]|uniref:protease complex subunit PrcB family protein n=1 Tax=Flavobacterium sp. SUN052 TaxID=3002441 RepID=UPI00237E4586|nr:protease complex subunit PrcB family protein [Flavobacterium sp. SUN052]MEC4005121.1 protease complex subunit PrcB family protein [Flavobacterium sp. SUN052]